MKRKLLSVLVAMFVLISSTNIFASTDAWLQNGEADTNGMVETEVKTEAINGSVILIAGEAPTAINLDTPVRFQFDADEGFVLADPEKSEDYRANTVGGYVSATMQETWYGSAESDSVTPDLDTYYNLNIVEISKSTTQLVLEVSVTRNEKVFEGRLVAHLEPELSADIEVYFVEKEVEPTPTPTPTPTRTPAPRYTVSAVSNPVDVATFTGTGGGYLLGQNYAVDYELVDSNYVFTGWTGVPVGTIPGNVTLVANFKLNVFDVTAISIPEGVGTFTGILTDVPDETSYDVLVDSIADGYEFVKWLGGTPSGNIEGENIELIAVFEEIPVVIDLPDDETPLVLDSTEIIDDVLPEAGGVPMEAFSLIGVAMAGTGMTLRKKNKK